MIENEILRNGWGILLPGQRGATPDTSTGNLIEENEIHKNARAGIAVRNGTSGNFIVGNDAKGNGKANVAPSFKSDIFGDLDNTFDDNKGTFLEG